MRITIKDYEKEINSFNYRLKQKYFYIYKHCNIDNHYPIVLYINSHYYWIQWDNGLTITYWKMGAMQEQITRWQFFRVIRDYNNKLKLYEQLNINLEYNNKKTNKNVTKI